MHLKLLQEQSIFKPDALIFKETTVYDYNILKQRLREMAFLTKGLRITLTDMRVEEGEDPRADTSTMKVE